MTEIRHRQTGAVLLSDPSRSLSQSDLRGRNLLGAALPAADLRGMDLRGTDLCDANLEKSRLDGAVGSSRVDLQACKLEYSIVSPK